MQTPEFLTFLFIIITKKKLKKNTDTNETSDLLRKLLKNIKIYAIMLDELQGDY